MSMGLAKESEHPGEFDAHQDVRSRDSSRSPHGAGASRISVTTCSIEPAVASTLVSSGAATANTASASTESNQVVDTAAAGGSTVPVSGTLASGGAAMKHAPTSSVYGNIADWHTRGELLFRSDGDIIGRMREVQPPAVSGEQLAAISSHLDNIEVEWRAVVQLHSHADRAQVQRVAAVICHHADSLCDLVKRYENSVSQHSKLADDIIGSVRDIEVMLKNPAYAESLHLKHKHFYQELTQQLGRVYAQQRRVEEDLAKLTRHRDRARALKEQAAGATPAMELDTNFEGPFVAVRATSSTDSESVVHLKTAPSTKVITSSPTVGMTSDDIIPSSECKIDEVSERGGGSGPRLKLDRWSDMTDVRTKLRQLNQRIAGFSLAVKRQYLCQVLPSDQIIMIYVEDPGGTIKPADIHTLSYEGMVRALLSKFDTATDREIARTKINKLKMSPPRSEQQSRDLPAFFHDNVYYPLLEACYKYGEMKEDDFSAKQCQDVLTMYA
jgi:hypothetical protein